MTDRCLIVLRGTLEIERPLFAHLICRLHEPVLTMQAMDSTSLANQLQTLPGNEEVVLLPCNELTLNLAANAVNIVGSNRFTIPGTACRQRVYSAAELSDKAVWFGLMDKEGGRFNHFSLVRSRLISSQTSLTDLQDFPFPAVLKPCRKDAFDRFSDSHPAKLIRLGSFEEAANQLREYADTHSETQFFLQEMYSGQPVSWCGYIHEGVLSGFQINALEKSPRGECGGTTTLAEVTAANKALVSAVSELAEKFKLDGIFEIEFILAERKLHFFHEINPRPWLQVSLVLDLVPDVITSYLEQIGFHLVEHLPKTRRSSPYWGSAWRYIALNRKAGLPINGSRLIRIVRHDVRFGRYFTWREKTAYARTLINLLLSGMIGK